MAAPEGRATSRQDETPVPLTRSKERRCFKWTMIL